MVKKIISVVMSLILTLMILPCAAFAHGGRTDSSGGHKDNKNKSGLGSYHYHCGGNPAHLHTNGECPYDSSSSTSKLTKSSTSNSSESSSSNSTTSINIIENPDQLECKLIDNHIYVFDDKGNKVTGSYSNENLSFHLNKDGMLYSWSVIEGDTYYLGNDGEIRVGYKKIDGNNYYFSEENGTMQVGWVKIGSKYHYFDKDGKEHFGWLKIGEKNYYIRSNGCRAINCKLKINDVVYEFDEQGVCTNKE